MFINTEIKIQFRWKILSLDVWSFYKSIALAEMISPTLLSYGGYSARLYLKIYLMPINSFVIDKFSANCSGADASVRELDISVGSHR